MASTTMTAKDAHYGELIDKMQGLYSTFSKIAQENAQAPMQKSRQAGTL